MDTMSLMARAAVRVRTLFLSIAPALACGAGLAGLLSPAFAADLSPAAKRAAVAASTRYKNYLGGAFVSNKHLPLAAKPGDEVTVVVRLTEAPVAELRQQSATHTITAADHAMVHAQIDRQQAEIEPAIVSRGGRVLAHYRDALNGIKIKIARSELAGLSEMPGVIDVLPVAIYHRTNVESVPFIGAPSVWQGVPGYKGEGVKIAIIDTGIDYTHANFGGPGTVAAFQAAAASSTKPADSSVFGPKAPKVKGGTDLVGDDYDASNPDSVPVPDPNPLDCNGHGSHVAGTAAGFGVANDGSTFYGPYNAAVYSKEKFLIGPGVAPNADLYAVRVFGCSGSTNVVAEAIDWAVDNDMDVISMSLGADFGPVNTADAIAVANAAKAGIIVVSASGNSGPQPYVASTPASGQGGIGVAAFDSHEFLAGGVTLTLSGVGTVDGVETNAAKLPGGKLPTKIITASGALSLGCDASDYPKSGVKGAVVIISRGTCTFAQKGAVAVAAGAAALGVVNNADGYFNPAGVDTLAIPFIALLLSDTPEFLQAPASTTASLKSVDLPNPGFRMAATFSSAGPRFGDSALRPNIAAPGVNIVSTAVGTGTGSVSDSGTSMATPHVSGVAALVREAHPDWTEDEQRGAVVDTAGPGKLHDYTPRIEGSGMVQAYAATVTQAVVINAKRPGAVGGLFYGFEEFSTDFKATREVSLRNRSKSRVSFDITTSASPSVRHTATLSKTHMTVEGGMSENVDLTLAVPAKTIGGTHYADGSDAFREVAGIVKFTPTDGTNNGVQLTMPYYLVPRARSNATAVIARQPTKKAPMTSVVLSNPGGALDTAADFYAFGLFNDRQPAFKYFDIRAVGVQSNPVAGDDSLLVFAINTWTRFSSADAAEFDILIDTDNDGTPDFLLATVDQGYFDTGTEENGIPITVLVNLKTGAAAPEFFVDAPTDGSTVLMPVLASDLGVTPYAPRFTYTAQVTSNIDSSSEVLADHASFNAFNPAISTGIFVNVPKGKTTTVPFSVDPVEARKTPYKGLMIMMYENVSGSRQAVNVLVDRP